MPRGLAGRAGNAGQFHQPQFCQRLHHRRDIAQCLVLFDRALPVHDDQKPSQLGVGQELAVFQGGLPAFGLAKNVVGLNGHGSLCGAP
jgi:hypothetical protein